MVARARLARRIGGSGVSGCAGGNGQAGQAGVPLTFVTSQSMPPVDVIPWATTNITAAR